MPNSFANSRISLTCSALLMSLFGAKWSGTRAIRPRSNTSAAPSDRNAWIAIGLVTSLPRARSTFARISSPGATSFLPACLARIFSVSVMLLDRLPVFRALRSPTPDRVDHLGHRPGNDVCGYQDEDHHLRLRRQQQREEDEYHQRVEGAPPERLEVFEGVEPDGAHHEKGEHVDRQEHGEVLEAPRPAQVVEEQDHGGDEDRRRWDGKPVELPLLHRVDLDVEARESQRPADEVEERRQPSPSAERGEGPPVDEERGSDAEGHEIGQGVVLDTESRGRVRHPGDAAIETVEDRPDDDPDRRLLEVAVVRGCDRVEPGEQGSRRDEVRQDVDPPPQAVSIAPPPASHGRIPITLSPARTWSPGATDSRTSAGRYRSTREPNRIIPTRCPWRTASPSLRSHTIRRATIPAICTYVTVRPSGVAIVTPFCSFMSDALSTLATWYVPLWYRIAVTRPDTGARLTWTSMPDMKTLTRLPAVAAYLPGGDSPA